LKYDCFTTKSIFFEEKDMSSNGYSWGYKYTVCFNTANSGTGVHELLHALELAHTFDGYSPNTKFTYEYMKTDNIMDYSHGIVLQTSPNIVYFQRKSLYH